MVLLRGYSSVARRPELLKGVFIPLTTPFNKENEDICHQALRSNMAKYEKIDFSGYVVAGTNGEAPYLTATERIQLVKTVRESTEKLVIGGATAESTRITCEIAEEMKKVGADALLVMPPFYFRKRMTEEALHSHYVKVAETSGLPVVIYNMPMVTGIDIGTAALTKLAEHPLIVGVKDTDIRKCAGTVQETKGLNFNVLIGSAGYLLGSLLAGCSGGINGLAGIMGNDLCTIYRLFNSGRIVEANEIQNRISRPDSLFLSELGVPGLKAGMDLLGYCGGPCRKPILPPSQRDLVRIRESLETAGFLS